MRRLLHIPVFVEFGTAEGVVSGCTLKAAAVVTEDAAMETDTELAVQKASATASFTGYFPCIPLLFPYIPV